MCLHGIDIDNVEKVEFAFSQNLRSTPLKLAEFPGDDTVDLGNNTIGVIWTPQDTMLFESGESFYADTRITMNNSEYQPYTPIVKLKMEHTLFETAVI